jgi:hypothetical protein
MCTCKVQVKNLSLVLKSGLREQGEYHAFRVLRDRIEGRHTNEKRKTSEERGDRLARFQWVLPAPLMHSDMISKGPWPVDNSKLTVH